jgi:hypothetical protein
MGKPDMSIFTSRIKERKFFNCPGVAAAIKMHRSAMALNETMLITKVDNNCLVPVVETSGEHSRSVLEEPVRSSSFPINRERNDPRNDQA